MDGRSFAERFWALVAYGGVDMAYQIIAPAIGFEAANAEQDGFCLTISFDWLALVAKSLQQKNFRAGSGPARARMEATALDNEVRRRHVTNREITYKTKCDSDDVFKLAMALTSIYTHDNKGVGRFHARMTGWKPFTVSNCNQFLGPSGSQWFAKLDATNQAKWERQNKYICSLIIMKCIDNVNHAMGVCWCTKEGIFFVVEPGRGEYGVRVGDDIFWPIIQKDHGVIEFAAFKLFWEEADYTPLGPLSALDGIIGNKKN